MKSSRKRHNISSTADVGKKKGREAKASTGKPSSRKYSAINRSPKGTMKQTIRVRHRATRQEKAKKTGNRRLTIRAPSVRRSVIHRSQMGKRLKSIKNAPRRRSTSKTAAKKKIIRVLDRGQFVVDPETLRKLNAIDNSIVRKLESGSLGDQEFKTKVQQLSQLVTKKGKPLDPKMIVGSDIILPHSDLSIEEASKIFYGEGIIPGLD
jgi:hypothetical protein